MSTKAQIYDSLFNFPVTRAALFGVLRLQAGPPQWVAAMEPRAERIRKRFKLHDLVLRWKSAS